ncbi:CoA-binding protein [Candidatus Woesebacteria bacterium]|nr:CoA-binding protein [Candidatus Woesebacteria bacterium]
MQYNKKTKIAVIGVSADSEKYGHRIFRDLIDSNYSVVGVNPKGGTILGQKIFTSLEEIPEKPELLLIVVPPNVGMSVLQTAVKLDITDVWLQPGAQSDELLQFALDNNLRLTHTDCFMVAHGIW